MALCFGTYPPQSNGGSEFLERIAEHLIHVGVRPVVVTSKLSGEPDHATANGVTVYRIVDDWRIGHRGRRSIARVSALVENEGVDVVHVVFPDSEVEADYQIPAFLGRKRPLVSTFWNLGLGRRSPMRLRLSSLALLGRSSILSSHDPAYLRQLRRLSAGRPVRWLPVGSNVGPPTSLTVLDPAADWLAYFGQLDATRGLEDLFEAVALLRHGGRDVRLMMIGSRAREARYANSTPAVWREYRRLSEMPDALGISAAVEWTPYLDEAGVAATLSAATLCVFPYRRNSIGRSALAAAFSVGAPVVLAGQPELVEPLEPGRHVALVPRADSALLARKIAEVLDDSELRGRLATGSAAAAHFFSWPRIAMTARSMYEEALERS